METQPELLPVCCCDDVGHHDEKGLSRILISSDQNPHFSLQRAHQLCADVIYLSMAFGSLAKPVTCAFTRLCSKYRLDLLLKTN